MMRSDVAVSIQPLTCSSTRILTPGSIENDRGLKPPAASGGLMFAPGSRHGRVHLIMLSLEHPIGGFSKWGIHKSPLVSILICSNDLHDSGVPPSQETSVWHLLLPSPWNDLHHNRS